MKTNQLFRLAPVGFRLPCIVESGTNIHHVDAECLPLMRWPDGRWCFAANSFMLELFRNGLARLPRGGTLGTYAAYLSHLIRFCHAAKTDFHELTDQQFTLFMRTLHGERQVGDELARVREASTTVAIGHLCLKFLEHVGELSGQPDFVGPLGAIRAKRRTNTYRGVTRLVWDHPSFPARSGVRSRLPISLHQIQRLQMAATEHSSSLYQRLRRYVMLRLLEITGGRRTEVVGLTVESVRAAVCMDKPALSLVTLKRGDRLHRLVPISRHDAHFLLDFANRAREKVIKTTCGRAADDGILLVSETTGRGLKSNTITQEIWGLALRGGVEGKACAHMFRHRFITKLFVALIEQHAIENEDSFRRMLVSTETFKSLVLEWTGHRRAESLDRYIHLAFAEFAGAGATIDAVNTLRDAEAAQHHLAQLERDLTEGMRPDEAVRRMKLLLANLNAGLKATSASA
jgi:integrase